LEQLTEAVSKPVARLDLYFSIEGSAADITSNGGVSVTGETFATRRHFAGRAKWLCWGWAFHCLSSEENAGDVSA
jgi:hypothetical protein